VRDILKARRPELISTISCEGHVDRGSQPRYLKIQRCGGDRDKELLKPGVMKISQSLTSRDCRPLICEPSDSSPIQSSEDLGCYVVKIFEDWSME
jgi:hypothetical protein